MPNLRFNIADRETRLRKHHQKHVVGRGGHVAADENYEAQRGSSILDYREGVFDHKCSETCCKLEEATTKVTISSNR